jgi:hypothetical protein
MAFHLISAFALVGLAFYWGDLDRPHAWERYQCSPWSLNIINMVIMETIIFLPTLLLTSSCQNAFCTFGDAAVFSRPFTVCNF